MGPGGRAPLCVRSHTLHRTHVSLIERGKRMPSLLVIKKLAAALGTTMADLMRELEQPTSSEQSPADGATQHRTSRKRSQGQK